MQKIQNTIGRLEESLCEYLDGLLVEDTCDGVSNLSIKRGQASDACQTLNSKFEMLCHNVGILYKLKNPLPRETEKDEVEEVELPITKSEKHTIVLAKGQLDRTNIQCSFYTMVNMSASLRDVLAKLVVRVYREEFEAMDQSKKINFENPSSERLAEVLGKQRPLGAAMFQFMEESEEYKLIIKLRNTLEHESVMGVLFWDFYGNRPNLKVHHEWSPTGEDITLPEYVRFVFRVSVALISGLCNRIAKDPGGCIKKVDMR